MDTGGIFYDYMYVSVNEQLFYNKIGVVSDCFHSFLLGASSRLLELLQFIYSLLEELKLLLLLEK